MRQAQFNERLRLRAQSAQIERISDDDDFDEVDEAVTEPSPPSPLIENRCAQCELTLGTIFRDSDAGLICMDCHGSATFCGNCGQATIVEFSRVHNSQHLCVTCDGEYLRCNDCNATEHRESARSTQGGGRVCRNCIIAYLDCQNCGERCVAASIENEICAQCRERRAMVNNPSGAGGAFVSVTFPHPPIPIPRRPVIQIYGHEHQPSNLRFKSFRPAGPDGQAEHFIGIELEIETQGAIRREWIAEKAAAILGEEFYCKRDGSLRDGVEIVSHPFVMKLFPFDKLREFCKTMSAAGARSFSPGTCGLHVHVSRFGLPQGCLPGSELEKIVYRGLRALSPILLSLSKRSDSSWVQRYCKFPQEYTRLRSCGYASKIALPTRAPNTEFSPPGNSDRTYTSMYQYFGSINHGATNIMVPAIERMLGCSVVDRLPAPMSGNYFRVIINSARAEVGMSPLGATITASKDFLNIWPDLAPMSPEDIKGIFAKDSDCKCPSCVKLKKRQRAESGYKMTLDHYVKSAASLTRQDMELVHRECAAKAEQYYRSMGDPIDGPDWREDRYSAINFRNRSTLEVRFFRGTLHPESAINSIKFSYHLILFLSSVSKVKLLQIETGAFPLEHFWYQLLSSMPADLRQWAIERSSTKKAYKNAKGFFESKKCQSKMQIPKDSKKSFVDKAGKSLQQQELNT